MKPIPAKSSPPPLTLVAKNAAQGARAEVAKLHESGGLWPPLDLSVREGKHSPSHEAVFRLRQVATLFQGRPNSIPEPVLRHVLPNVTGITVQHVADMLENVNSADDETSRAWDRFIVEHSTQPASGIGPQPTNTSPVGQPSASQASAATGSGPATPLEGKDEESRPSTGAEEDRGLKVEVDDSWDWDQVSRDRSTAVPEPIFDNGALPSRGRRTAFAAPGRQISSGSGREGSSGSDSEAGSSSGPQPGPALTTTTTSTSTSNANPVGASSATASVTGPSVGKKALNPARANVVNSLDAAQRAYVATGLKPLNAGQWDKEVDALEAIRSNYDDSNKVAVALHVAEAAEIESALQQGIAYAKDVSRIVMSADRTLASENSQRMAALVEQAKNILKKAGELPHDDPRACLELVRQLVRHADDLRTRLKKEIQGLAVPKDTKALFSSEAHAKEQKHLVDLMEKAVATENLTFMLAVDSWLQRPTLEGARALREHFINEGSDEQVNIADNLRAEIEKLMDAWEADGEKPASTDLLKAFKEARAVINNLIGTNQLLGVLKTIDDEMLKKATN